MKNFWKWFIGIILVLVLVFGPYLLRLAFPAIGYGHGMIGYGRGMMGGFGFFPFSMALMWFVPLGTIALAVLGIVWLVNNLNALKTTTPQGRACLSCGKFAELDWKTCPYCGNNL